MDTDLRRCLPLREGEGSSPRNTSHDRRRSSSRRGGGYGYQGEASYLVLASSHCACLIRRRPASCRGHAGSFQGVSALRTVLSRCFGESAAVWGSGLGEAKPSVGEERHCWKCAGDSSVAHLATVGSADRS